MAKGHGMNHNNAAHKTSSPVIVDKKYFPEENITVPPYIGKLPNRLIGECFVEISIIKVSKNGVIKLKALVSR